jgi:hypothetical protein
MRNGLMLYRDDNHISIAGSAAVIDRLIFRKILP